MRYIKSMVIIICLSFLFCGCVSIHRETPDGHKFSYTRMFGKMQITGFEMKRVNKEGEEESAKLRSSKAEQESLSEAIQSLTSLVEFLATK